MFWTSITIIFPYYSLPNENRKDIDEIFYYPFFPPLSRSIVDRLSKSIKRSHTSLADALLPPPPPTTGLSPIPRRKKILEAIKERKIAFPRFFVSTSKFDSDQILCLPCGTRQIYSDQFPDYFGYYYGFIPIMQILISMLIVE